MKLFRIKNNYKAANQETGAVEKVKEEYLVSAVNYTDAESFIVNYNETRGHNKFIEAEYEIVKEKFPWYNIMLNDVFDFEPGEKVCGYDELFFNDDTDRLFAVTVRFLGNKEANEKDYNKTYYIPAKSVVDAIKYLKSRVVNEDDEYMVTKTAADNMVSLFLTEELHESMRNESMRNGL